jgi:hypothetical protein
VTAGLSATNFAALILPDMVGLVSALGVSQAVIVGHDWGVRSPNTPSLALGGALPDPN